MESQVMINLLSLLLIAASMAGTWMIFVKAGERGWKAVIPFYNYYTMLRITKHSGWWVAAIVVPVVLVFLAGATVSYELINLSANSAQILVDLVAVVILISTPVAITINAVVMYDIARAFGKQLPFTIGLTLLPFIFLVWLGFGDETFRALAEDTHSKDIDESVDNTDTSDEDDNEYDDKE